MNNQHFLSFHIKNFFSEYLQKQRGLSKHTISSYRDTFKILLNFLSLKLGSEFLNNFTVFDLNVQLVISFLNYLENKESGRANKPQTRNNRLSAIFSFCRYLSFMNPAYDKCTRKILNIPLKRTYSSTMDCFEQNEMELLLNTINTTKKDGFRDMCVLLTLYNTGMRANSLSQLKISSLILDIHPGVKIVTKGNKQQILPIWQDTAELLKTYIRKYRRKPEHGFEDYLFINQRGKFMSRFALRLILKKYLQKAILKNPQLQKKRLSTHSIRATTATHLDESGVDPFMIKNWLGHSSIDTTSRYLKKDDLHRKRQILNDNFQSPNYVKSFFGKKIKPKETKEDLYRLLNSI